MTWDITGMAAVANIGASPEKIFAALCAGQESRTPLRAFAPDKYRAAYAYEIDDRPEGGGDIPRRATRWLTTVVRQAVADAGLGEDLSQVPVLVGTTMREQRSLELWWRDDADVALADLHFGTALKATLGASTTYTFANACSATLYALGMATDMIELGMADTVVIAGTDAATESGFGTLDRVQNDIPDALRPFDTTHKGMLMGEGAAAVVVQRAGTGNGRVHARVRGVSMNCDAHHATAPDPDGITRAVQDAYSRAGVRAQDIDLVMLHGSGTPRNDATESSVLSRIFHGAGSGPRMTAIKAMTGHTLGGSGLLSLVMAVLAMKAGTVPPVLGLTDPIPEAAGLDLVQGAPAAGGLTIAQIDAFGFGGINAVAIVEAARPMSGTSTARMSIPSAREVVVTGIGLALPGVAKYGDLLGPLPGEGGFDPATGLRGREMRHKDRASRLALRAAESALHDAGLTDATATFTGVADSTAVVVSTNLGNVDSVCEAADTIAREGVTGLSPLGLPQTSSNVVAGWVAIRFGLRGPNLTVCNGVTSGLDALAWARNLIEVGRAAAAVVVGVEPANDVATRLVGKQSTDAAVAIVLESANAAASRGVRPRATIAGYARARDLAVALTSAGVTEEKSVGLWLVDEAGAGAGQLLAATRQIDLEAQLGPLSGALGVLQCAAAAAHLERDATGIALATAGGPRHDAAAALLLTP